MADCEGVDMANGICSVEKCGQASRARGMCTKHYQQWRTATRSQIPTRPRMAAEERFWSRADRSGGQDACWPWTGPLYRGYGSFTAYGRGAGAHRFAYEFSTGELLGDLHIDHLCFNRSCVNPKHLRAVTREQNNQHLRGAQRNSKSGVQGVFWRPKKRLWCAQVKHQGKVHHVGYFKTVEEAADAVRRVRCELFTHNDADRIG